MTDEPDGAYDWPHAVGAESKARQWRVARGIHDTEMRSGDKIDELLVAYSRESWTSYPNDISPYWWDVLTTWQKTAENLMAEIARLCGLLEALGNAWRVFHGALPNGEYKGLGELRLIIRKCDVCGEPVKLPNELCDQCRGGAS